MVTYSIGRDGGNDVVIDDLSVSRRHARIEEIGDDRYMIIDLASSNGCYVEQSDAWQLFAEAEVQATDALMLGEYRTTARELIRLVAKPRPPRAETVLASAERTQQGVHQANAGRPNARRTLGAVWSRLPEYQKYATFVVAAEISLLIVVAIAIGALGGF